MITDALILRTMTLKSKLNFGRFENLTIQEIINLKHTQYLRYIYYSVAGLSFNEEILKLIGIIFGDHDNRILKPGTDLYLHEKLNKSKKYSRINMFGYFIVKGQQISGRKMRLRQLHILENKIYSKGALKSRNQKINHGK